MMDEKGVGDEKRLKEDMLKRGRSGRMRNKTRPYEKKKEEEEGRDGGGDKEREKRSC